MKVPCHILLAAAHFSKYRTTQFSGSKANASLFPLVFQVPEDLPLFPIFTFVAVLCGGCQTPGKTSLTGLFIGDFLPALKYTKFVFEILQHGGNNVIPVLHTSVVLSVVICAQAPALPGSVPVAMLPILCTWVQPVFWSTGFCRSGSMKYGGVSKYLQMYRIKLRALETGWKPLWKRSQLG